MAIYYPILTDIDINETRRYAGLSKKVDFKEELLREACTELQIISHPKANWTIYRYDSDKGIIMAAAPFKLTGKSITRHLYGCEFAAVLAVTIGSEVEQAINTHFSSGNYTAGLLLDAAATTAVEAAADQVSKLIAKEARAIGLTTTNRFSPGYGDWDIVNQPTILKLAGASSIGISATSSCILVPRKSVTAVIGLFSAEQKTMTTTNTNCQVCNQIDCLARKE